MSEIGARATTGLLAVLIAAPLGAAEKVPGRAFRGSGGTAVYHQKGLPTSWSEADKKNIRWKTALTLPGWASAVVARGRVIVTGANAEKRMAWCMAVADGKQQWVTELPVVAGATEGYQTDTMDPEWDARMYAAGSPVTDGRHVYVIFSNGQLAALRVADGTVAWNLALGDSSLNQYGLTGSLRLYGDKLIVVFQGEKRFVAAHDVVSGKQVWKTERGSSSWATPSLITTAGGKDLLVLLGDPDLTAWNPSSGKKVWTIDILSGKPDACVGPSPIFDGTYVYVNCQGSGIYAVDPDAGKKVWGLEELPEGFGFSDGASMVANDGCVYQFYDTVLSCIDASNGNVIKELEVDARSSYASPFLNGKHLYLVTAEDVRVLKADPDTGFAVVGKGTLSGRIEGSPTVAGDAIFIRTDDAIYCIGK